MIERRSFNASGVIKIKYLTQFGTDFTAHEDDRVQWPAASVTGPGEEGTSCSPSLSASSAVSKSPSLSSWQGPAFVSSVLVETASSQV
jgi:hypothetical protein